MSRRGAGTWVAQVPLAKPGPPAGAEPPSRPARFNFNPGVPDLTAFPRPGGHERSGAGFGTLPPRSRLRRPPRPTRAREALADYLARVRGVAADPDLIVVVAGFGNALSLLTRHPAPQGVTKIAMEDPCLFWHRHIAASAGLEITPIPVDEEGARQTCSRTRTPNWSCSRPRTSSHSARCHTRAPYGGSRLGASGKPPRDRG